MITARDIIDAFKSIPFERIGRFFQFLIIKQPIALLGIALLSTLSGCLGSWYYTRSAEYEKIVSNTLQADLESTPQRYKGLEAFILSNIESGIDEDLKKCNLSSDFRNQFIRLKTDLDAFFNSKEDIVINLDTVAVSEGKTLTDNHKPGFLFFPINVIHTPFTKAERDILDGRDEKRRRLIIAEKLEADKPLRTEVSLTKFLAETLQEFTDKSIIDKVADVTKEGGKASAYLQNHPPQVYIITKNGLNRIFNDLTKGTSTYYSKQFSSNTFFPSRPYFWAPFKEGKVSVYNKKIESPNFEPKERQNIDQFFHVSKPYMDLGGNGIVITLSRAIEIDGVTQAVLCFDITFGKNRGIKQILKDRMDEFQGAESNIEVACRVDNGGRVECSPESLRNNDVLKELLKSVEQYINLRNNDVQKELLGSVEQYIKDHKKQLSEIFGNIQVLNIGEKDGSLQISVPVAPAKYDEDSQTATFLLLNLNLAEHRWNTTLIGFSAITVLVIMILLLAYLWGSTSRHTQEYREALKEVAKVMNESPTPFVHLDSKDIINDFNRSFCEKLGYETTEEGIQELKKHTFQSLCADSESQKQYEEIQSKRKEKMKVAPYKLNLKMKNGTSIPVKVVSAEVPSDARGVLPETFGILLEDESVSKDSLNNVIPMGTRS